MGLHRVLVLCSGTGMDYASSLAILPCTTSTGSTVLALGMLQFYGLLYLFNLGLFDLPFLLSWRLIYQDH